MSQNFTKKRRAPQHWLARTLALEVRSGGRLSGQRKRATTRAVQQDSRGKNQRLYVSDLDGTLLGKGAELSDYSRATLLRLLEQGLPFTVATARSQVSLLPLLKGLPLSLPVVELNGAFLTDLRAGRVLHQAALSWPLVERVLGLGKLMGLEPMVSSFVDGAQWVVPPVQVSNAGMQWYLEERKRARDHRLRSGEAAAALVAQHAALAPCIMCLTFIAQREPLSELLLEIERLAPEEEVLCSELPHATNTVMYRNPYDPKWHWLTVQAAAANKGSALRRLAEHCGVSCEAVTVFGDEVNDLPMFEVAGTAVAVDNAVPGVKARAHRVVGSHQLDSVVQYLEDDWKR